jgi:PAS domain-containing protein
VDKPNALGESRRARHDGDVTEAMPGPSHSLPLILARELAANLATPMILLDGRGTLVYFNDAAALLIGKTFGEVGEIQGSDFHKHLSLTTVDGRPVRPRESAAGIAFFQQRPAHKRLIAKPFDGVRRVVDETAYPLFGANDEMDGVVSVFWEHIDEEPVA